MKFPVVIAPDEEVALAAEAAAEEEDLDVAEPILNFFFKQKNQSSVSFLFFFFQLLFPPNPLSIKRNTCVKEGRKESKKLGVLSVPVAEVADREDVLVAEAAAAEEDEDTEE